MRAILSTKAASFQLTAARRRLGSGAAAAMAALSVSTHSRPKAAGGGRVYVEAALNNKRFNSQPPEGGWGHAIHIGGGVDVSTHSRPKAAGILGGVMPPAAKVSTHSRPKAAGCTLFDKAQLQRVSTHSRPKAAGPA